MSACRSRLVIIAALLAVLVVGCAQKRQFTEEELLAARKSTEEFLRNLPRKKCLAADSRPLIEERPVVWALPLFASLDRFAFASADELQFVDDGDLLMAGRETRRLEKKEEWLPVYRRIDASTGKLQWEHWIESQGKASTVFEYRRQILVRVASDEGEGTTLVAIDSASGHGLWSKTSAAPAHFLPLLGAEAILAVERGKRSTLLAAYDLSSGATLWKSEHLQMTWGAGYQHLPLVAQNELWDFFAGVRQLSPRDGTAVWERGDIRLDRRSPPPQLDQAALVLIDQSKRLFVLDAASGRTKVSVPLPEAVEVANIYPYGERIYLRGRSTDPSDQRPFKLVAVRRTDGGVLWTHADDEPGVSNLIESNGRLFFATPSKVMALDLVRGDQRFAAAAASSGRSFPVRIRFYPGKVVYLGELIVAAFDPATGAKVYSQWVDPITENTHLDALDVQIERLERDLAFWNRGQLWNWGNSAFFTQEAAMHQNQATRSYALSRRYRSSNPSRSELEWGNARIESAFAKMSAQLALDSYVHGLIGNMFAARAQEVERRLRDPTRLRQSIFAAAENWEIGDYAVRPSRSGDSLGLTVIHLPSGKVSATKLGPAPGPGAAFYGTDGMLNLVDIEKRVVYHQGLRIAPDSCQNTPLNPQAVAYLPSLISQTVTLP